jgi:hypothetical protein
MFVFIFFQLDSNLLFINHMHLYYIKLHLLSQYASQRTLFHNFSQLNTIEYTHMLSASSIHCQLTLSFAQQPAEIVETFTFLYKLMRPTCVYSFRNITFSESCISPMCFRGSPYSNFSSLRLHHFFSNSGEARGLGLGFGVRSSLFPGVGDSRSACWRRQAEGHQGTTVETSLVEWWRTAVGWGREGSIEGNHDGGQRRDGLHKWGELDGG